MLVHRFVSNPESLLVNSYWIETEEGVIVIDSQFLLSDASKLRLEIEKSNKPISGIIITHPHPDHYNGIEKLIQKDNTIPIVSLASVMEEIKKTESQKRDFWKPKFGDDYPNSTILPNKIVQTGEVFEINHIRFMIEDLGPGESPIMSVIFLPDQKFLFCSDIVYNEIHPWLNEGRSVFWIKQIDYLLKKYADVETIFPGHGKSGGLDLFIQQKEYLAYLRDLITNSILHNKSKDKLSSEQIEYISNRLLTKFFYYEFESVVNSNIQKISEEIFKSND